MSLQSWALATTKTTTASKMRYRIIDHDAAISLLANPCHGVCRTATCRPARCCRSSAPWLLHVSPRKQAQARLSNRVLVVGGYGQLGSRICRLLSRAGPPSSPTLEVVVAGRNASKALQYSNELARASGCYTTGVGVDGYDAEQLQRVIRNYKVDTVVFACGP